MINPIGVKSKSLNGASPASSSAPLIRKLGGVPTSVVKPPSSEP